MINPVIFSFPFLGLTITLRWYGVLVMFGVAMAAWIAEREVNWRGENGETVWDALIYLIPAGVVGARLWYVLNATLGGNLYYLQNPADIFKVWLGGLHIFGGLLFGAVALWYYLKKRNKDLWLFLDAVAPVTLVGQALARPANFINQELYGPPTTLPWGIPIDALHRLPRYADLTQFPVETTRFHPVFAYEMIWNFIAFGLIYWLTRRYAGQLKPGTAFAAWLVLAGLGRFMLEFLRPDQPRIGEFWMSYTQLATLAMMLTGALLLLVRYRKIQLPFLKNWPEEYQILAK